MKASKLQKINDELIDAYGDIEISFGANLADPVTVGQVKASITAFAVTVKERTSEKMVVSTTMCIKEPAQPCPF